MATRRPLAPPIRKPRVGPTYEKLGKALTALKNMDPNGPEKRDGVRPPLKGGSSHPNLDSGKKEKVVRASVASILLAINELTLQDRKLLLAQLALDQVKDPVGDDSRDADMWARAVYDALTQAVGSQGGGIPGPAIIKRLLTPASVWGPLTEFMAASKLDELTVVERSSTYRLLATLLVGHCRGVARYAGAPLSPKLVANNVANVAAIFDNAFPGYVASGLAKMVARRGEILMA